MKFWYLQAHLNNILNGWSWCSKLSMAGLLLHPRKCLLFFDHTIYLGYFIDRQGLRLDPERVKSIISFPSPRNVWELKRGIGMVSYFRHFIEGFAHISAPLNALLKKGEKWRWEDEGEGALRALLGRLASAPILTHLSDSDDVV